MSLTSGVEPGPGHQTPGHGQHAVETGGELVRLGDHLQGGVESLHQGWQDELRSECCQVMQRCSSINESPPGPHGVVDNGLETLDKLSDVLITQTVLLGWSEAPDWLLVPLPVHSLDEAVGQLCHELCQLQTVFANVCWVEI